MLFKQMLNWVSVCRVCIYEKITEEELEGCPVCNTNLGGVPLEKLRYLPSLYTLH